MSTEACRYCGREPVVVKCLIPARLSHTGRPFWKACPIDACVADRVRDLQVGITEPITAGVCCGHGEGGGAICMADGTEIPIDPTSQGDTST